jgi:hypothetical protein
MPFEFAYTTLTSSVQSAVNFGFVQELWMIGLDAFQLDSHFFVGVNVGAEINITKGTATNLASDAILFSHCSFHDDSRLVLVLKSLLLLPPDGRRRRRRGFGCSRHEAREFARKMAFAFLSYLSSL